MPASQSSSNAHPVRLAILGCGSMARHHVAQMLEHPEQVVVPVVCEPSIGAYDRFTALYFEQGLAPPPNEPDLQRLLQRHSGELDAVFIITPHVFHHHQATLCMEAGLDVLLEKPMVMNAAEARSLIQTRDRTDSLLVVAFNGSLSPQIRTAVSLLRSGEFGRILEYSRRRLAELARLYSQHLAPEHCHVRRRILLRHRRPPIEHGCRPGRRAVC